jgi:beta-glucosidase-like glycosyl hydrolase
MDSGCDIGCDPFLNDFAKDAVEDGTITEATLDAALRRVYTPWLKIGSLDPGSDGGSSCDAFKDIGPEAVDTPLHRQLAYESAVQSIILLQNRPPAPGRKPLLPLKVNTKVALLGPHLNSTQAMISIYHMDMNGIYSVLAEKHSPLMSITAHSNSSIIGHEPGCTDGVACLDTSGFSRAAALAKSAEVAVIFLGAIPLLFCYVLLR